VRAAESVVRGCAREGAPQALRDLDRPARVLEGSSGLAAKRGHVAQELVRPAEDLVLTVFAREVERLVEPPLARVPLTHLEEHPARRARWTG